MSNADETLAPAAKVPTRNNAPEISVSELANALKRTVEDRFPFVRVRGEISNYRGPHASGHAYFCLKDQNARIDAVIWKSALTRMKTRPEEGLEVVATGKITTFPGKSAYQIVIEALEPAGVGALMALLDDRRKRLAAEGLFDSARKKPVPFLPKVIGVVTSPTGAVIRDILHRLSERFPRRVLLWPARVQGEASAPEVAAAIAGFNALPAFGPIPRPDVLIVARGGGSLEDLWGFNDEIVVRAAAASLIPLISAVGHETDTTLIDFAADLRAPTPTAAAEKCVPVRLDLVEQVAGLARRLAAGERRLLDERRARLSAQARLSLSGDALVFAARQRVDRCSELLPATARRGLLERRMTLSAATHVLARHSPHAELARVKEKLAGAARRLSQGLAVRLRLEKERAAHSRRRLDEASAKLERSLDMQWEAKSLQLARLEQLMQSLSHKEVLRRGFALVRNEEGGLIRSVAAVSPAMALNIEFADGRAGAHVDAAGATVEAVSQAPPRMRKRPSRGGDERQGRLF